MMMAMMGKMTKSATTNVVVAAAATDILPCLKTFRSD